MLMVDREQIRARRDLKAAVLRWSIGSSIPHRPHCGNQNGKHSLYFPIFSQRKERGTKSSGQAFFSSHRNSLEAHLSLLGAIQCETILLPERAPTVTKQILASRAMHVLPLPDLGVFMADGSDVEVYPWETTFAEMKDKTFVILHTSGSTGVPKPVFVSHGTFASNDAHQLIPSLGGNPTTVHMIRGKRMFLAFPLFHSASLNFAVGFSVFAGMTCVLPGPGPLTADTVNMVHTYGKVHGSLLPPSMIVDLYNKSEYLENMMQHLQFLAYVGGTLPKEVGDPISSKMRLITLMGSTETKLLPVALNIQKVDWEYLPISPFLGHEFRPARDGLHELVIVRNKEFELFQGVFSTFPSVDEYPMSDLYEQHPKNPALWAFRARADDIITLNNAEKLNPVTMESVISAHSAVNAAVIGGHGEFQVALLVEPKTDVHSKEDRAKLLQEIWPSVMHANRECPAHGRIMKNFVIFTSSGKPLPKAAKGTVQRYAALKLYADEFKALYASSKSQRIMQNGMEDDRCKPIMAAPVQPTTETLVERHLISDDGATEQQVKVLTAQPDGADSVKDYALAKLDARIEIILRRILPDALLEHLKPALAQVAVNLITHAIELPDSNKHSSVTLPASPSHIAQTSTDTENSNELGSDRLQQQQASSLEKQRDGNVRSQSPSKTATEASLNSSMGLRDCLHDAIASSTYLHDLSDSADLFECGLDSLQVIALVSEINAFLLQIGPDVKTISKETVYQNPSIDRILMVLKDNVRDLRISSIGEAEI